MSEPAPIARAIELVRALHVKSRRQVFEVLADDVEPLGIFEVTWHADGLSFVLETVYVDFEYPFSLTEFWDKLRQEESYARAALDERNRASDMQELADMAHEAGGVAAVQLSDISAACQFTTGRRGLTVAQRRVAFGYLAEANRLAVANLPKSARGWTLLWQQDAPIASQMRAWLPADADPARQAGTPANGRHRLRG